ncbi:unnamed protein product [Amoebophrya sp. A120]|nr:unnamed protein product [Amoebophrya sp. A120]|eukprot:GSA120T00012392001.1
MNSASASAVVGTLLGITPATTAESGVGTSSSTGGPASTAASSVGGTLNNGGLSAAGGTTAAAGSATSTSSNGACSLTNSLLAKAGSITSAGAGGVAGGENQGGNPGGNLLPAPQPGGAAAPPGGQLAMQQQAGGPAAKGSQVYGYFNNHQQQGQQPQNPPPVSGGGKQPHHTPGLGYKGGPANNSNPGGKYGPSYHLIPGMNEHQAQFGGKQHGGDPNQQYLVGQPPAWQHGGKQIGGKPIGNTNNPHQMVLNMTGSPEHSGVGHADTPQQLGPGGSAQSPSEQSTFNPNAPPVIDTAGGEQLGQSHHNATAPHNPQQQQGQGGTPPKPNSAAAPRGHQKLKRGKASAAGGNPNSALAGTGNNRQDKDGSKGGDQKGKAGGAGGQQHVHGHGAAHAQAIAGYHPGAAAYHPYHTAPGAAGGPPPGAMHYHPHALPPHAYPHGAATYYNPHMLPPNAVVPGAAGYAYPGKGGPMMSPPGGPQYYHQYGAPAGGAVPGAAGGYVAQNNPHAGLVQGGGAGAAAQPPGQGGVKGAGGWAGRTVMGANPYDQLRAQQQLQYAAQQQVFEEAAEQERRRAEKRARKEERKRLKKKKKLEEQESEEEEASKDKEMAATGSTGSNAPAGATNSKNEDETAADADNDDDEQEFITSKTKKQATTSAPSGTSHVTTTADEHQVLELPAGGAKNLLAGADHETTTRAGEEIGKDTTYKPSKEKHPAAGHVQDGKKKSKEVVRTSHEDDPSATRGREMTTEQTITKTTGVEEEDDDGTSADQVEQSAVDEVENKNHSSGKQQGTKQPQQQAESQSEGSSLVTSTNPSSAAAGTTEPTCFTQQQKSKKHSSRLPRAATEQEDRTKLLSTTSSGGGNNGMVLDVDDVELEIVEQNPASARQKQKILAGEKLSNDKQVKKRGSKDRKAKTDLGGTAAVAAPSEGEATAAIQNKRKDDARGPISARGRAGQQDQHQTRRTGDGTTAGNKQAEAAASSSDPTAVEVAQNRNKKMGTQQRNKARAAGASSSGTTGTTGHHSQKQNQKRRTKQQPPMANVSEPTATSGGGCNDRGPEAVDANKSAAVAASGSRKQGKTVTRRTGRDQEHYDEHQHQEREVAEAQVDEEDAASATSKHQVAGAARGDLTTSTAGTTRRKTRKVPNLADEQHQQQYLQQSRGRKVKEQQATLGGYPDQQREGRERKSSLHDDEDQLQEQLDRQETDERAVREEYRRGRAIERKQDATFDDQEASEVHRSLRSRDGSKRGRGDTSDYVEDHDADHGLVPLDSRNGEPCSAADGAAALLEGNPDRPDVVVDGKNVEDFLDEAEKSRKSSKAKKARRGRDEDKSAGNYQQQQQDFEHRSLDDLQGGGARMNERQDKEGQELRNDDAVKRNKHESPARTSQQHHSEDAPVAASGRATSTSVAPSRGEQVEPTASSSNPKNPTEQERNKGAEKEVQPRQGDSDLTPAQRWKVMKDYGTKQYANNISKQLHLEMLYQRFSGIRDLPEKLQDFQTTVQGFEEQMVIAALWFTLTHNDKTIMHDVLPDVASLAPFTPGDAKIIGNRHLKNKTEIEQGGGGGHAAQPGGAGGAQTRRMPPTGLVNGPKERPTNKRPASQQRGEPQGGYVPPSSTVHQPGQQSTSQRGGPSSSDPTSSGGAIVRPNHGSKPRSDRDRRDREMILRPGGSKYRGGGGPAPADRDRDILRPNGSKHRGGGGAADRDRDRETLRPNGSKQRGAGAVLDHRDRDREIPRPNGSRHRGGGDRDAPHGTTTTSRQQVGASKHRGSDNHPRGGRNIQSTARGAGHHHQTDRLDRDRENRFHGRGQSRRGGGTTGKKDSRNHRDRNVGNVNDSRDNHGNAAPRGGGVLDENINREQQERGQHNVPRRDHSGARSVAPGVHQIAGNNNSSNYTSAGNLSLIPVVTASSTGQHRSGGPNNDHRGINNRGHSHRTNRGHSVARGGRRSPHGRVGGGQSSARGRRSSMSMAGGSCNNHGRGGNNQHDRTNIRDRPGPLTNMMRNTERANAGVDLLDREAQLLRINNNISGRDGAAGVLGGAPPREQQRSQNKRRHNDDRGGAPTTGGPAAKIRRKENNHGGQQPGSLPQSRQGSPAGRTARSGGGERRGCSPGGGGSRVDYPHLQTAAGGSHRSGGMNPAANSGNRERNGGGGGNYNGQNRGRGGPMKK